MPKKKVIVEGQVIVTDKGTLKKTAKGAHSVDRRLKGAAKTSSNASKNFSKMSQGISGGLVPAYATLAASLFALDAVYRGLKEAADLRILQQGQMAFAAQTGMAMQSVTRNIQEATDSQISFKEASQAAAIGMAAGLSGEQMERLAAAATSAAKVLGRSVPDAFDRMTRGVIKAEPEVLDELGIILRLDTAAENYAQRLNISKDSLTVFEKSQAVLNEVLSQAETKYSDVAESIQPNTWQQFGTAMEKVKDEMMIFVDKILAPVAKFLSGNVWAAVGAMGIFISSVMKGLLPTYAEQKEKFVQSQLAQQQSIDATREKLKALKLQQEGMTEKGAMAMGGAQKASMAGAPKDRRTTIGKLQRGEVISAKQASNEIVRIEKLKNQKVDGMTKKQSIKYKAYLAKIVAQDKRAHQKMAMHGEKHFLKTRVRWAKMQMIHKRVMGRMTQAANMMGRAASVAMSAFGWISMALMIFQGIKALIDKQKKIDHAQVALKEKTEELSGAYKELAKELTHVATKMEETTDKWTEGGQAISFYSNTLKNIPWEKTMRLLEMAGGKVSGELADHMTTTFEAISKIIPGFQQLTKGTMESVPLMIKYVQAGMRATNILNEGAGAVQSQQQAVEKLAKAEAKRYQDIVKSAYRDEVNALETILKAQVRMNILAGKQIEDVDVTIAALNRYVAIENIASIEKQKQADLTARISKTYGIDAKRAKQILKNEITASKIVVLEAEKVKLAEDLEQIGDNASEYERSKVILLQKQNALKLEQLNIDKELGESMLDLSDLIESAAQKGFASGMQKGLEDMLLLKGDLGDLVVGVGKAMAAGMAKTLSDQMVQMMGAKWDFLKDPKQEITEENTTAVDSLTTEMANMPGHVKTYFEEIKNAETNGLAKFKEAVELLAEENGELLEGIRGILLKIDEKKTEAERAAAGEGTGWYGEQGWKDIKVPDYIAADEAKAAADAKEMDEIRALTDPAAVAAAKDASTYGFGTKEGVSDADKEALIVKILAIEAEILALKEAKSKQGQGTSEGSRAHTGKIIKAKEDEIDALVDTTKTVKELNPALSALGGATAGVSKGLTQIWDSVSGGGFSSFFGKFWPSATGGYVTNKGIQGFAGGGKVPGVYKGKDSVPAMLSPGETVLTPGQLKGIGGSNTVVNVNMGEGGATISGQQSDSASAAAFGKAIAGAVNKEIAKQKRIGGTLYTQGPGGW